MRRRGMRGRWIGRWRRGEGGGEGGLGGVGEKKKKRR